MRGERTIGLVVAETTKAIWSCLQPLYMPVPDENMWKCIANRYLELWSLPNCIGAIDVNMSESKSLNMEDHLIIIIKVITQFNLWHVLMQMAVLQQLMWEI